MRARRRLARRRRCSGGGCNREKTHLRPSIPPSRFGLPIPPFLPLVILFARGSRRRFRRTFRAPGAVAIVGIISHTLPALPLLDRRSSAHPFVRAGTPPTRYPPLLLFPDSMPGARHLTAHFRLVPMARIARGCRRLVGRAGGQSGISGAFFHSISCDPVQKTTLLT